MLPLTKIFINDCVQRRNRILQQAGAAVIVSSSWRKTHALSEIVSILQTACSLAQSRLQNGWQKTARARVQSIALRRQCTGASRAEANSSTLSKTRKPHPLAAS